MASPPVRLRRARWRLAYGAVLLAAAILSACAALRAPQRPGTASVPAKTFAFRDGGATRYFEFVRQLAGTADLNESWVFVFPGSGCAGLGPLLPAYFTGLDGESGRLRVFVVEKRGSNAGTASECSDTFVRDDHPRRWLADYREFVESQLARGRPQRVVLVGISEGAEVVPALGRSVAGVTHVVLLANPGADPLRSYRKQGEKHTIAGVDDVLRAIAAPHPPDPDAPEARLAGRSFRYWAELSELATRENLLRLDVPVLIGIGDADALVPSELALETRDAAAQAGRPLKLILFPDADHALVDVRTGRSCLPDFWHAVDLWLSE